MVLLTRLGGPVFALNPDLIERAEATPDTVVTLVNGSKYVIRESLEELTELITTFRARVIGAAQSADHLYVVSGSTPAEPMDVAEPVRPRPVPAIDAPPNNVRPLRSGES